MVNGKIKVESKGKAKVREWNRMDRPFDYDASVVSLLVPYLVLIKVSGS